MITIKIEPDLMKTGYNEHILVLDSTNKTESKFQYIVDVKINGVVKSRIKQSNNPDGYGVIDLHKHLTPYISYDIDIDAGKTFRRIPNTYTKYNIDLYEEYVFNWIFDDNYFVTGSKVGFTASSTTHIFSAGDRVLIQQDSPYTNSSYNGVHNITAIPNTTSVETDIDFGSSSPTEPGTMSYADNRVSIFTATASLTSDKYYYNGVLDFTDVTTWDYTTYELGTANVGTFLSKNPNNLEVELDDRITMNIYNTNSNSNNLEIISDNGTFRIPNAYSFNQHTNKYLSVYVGPWDLLNTTDTVTVVSGSLPILDSSSKSYSVKVVNGSNNPVSETKTFKMVDNCTIYEKFKIYYMDRQGAFTSVSFNKVSRNNVAIKRDVFQKNHGSYNTTANTWGYNNYDRGDTTYNQEVDEIFNLNSDWVNEDLGQMISDMLQSTEVYHIDESGNLLAINILTNSYEKKKRINDMIFNYTLSFKYSYKNAQQI